MTLTTVWLIIALVSLTFSALFSGVEIAYISSNRVKVEIDVKRGGFIGRIINLYYKYQDLFISTILVGNNIMLVIYGMGAAELLDPWLKGIYDNEVFILLMQTLISTAIILITGEFFPKTIFRINPNSSLRYFALPIFFFWVILYPISIFTAWLSKTLMRMCGIKNENHSMGMLTVGELNQYIQTSIDEQAAKDEVENEVKIFHNAIDFSSTHLRDCMTPRNEVVAINIDTTTRDELSALFTSSGRSKIVVYRDDIDNVLGYIHVSELFDPKSNWKEAIKPVIFAPETLLANKMMRRLLAEKRSMAIVVDEFGGTAGLVSLEDLVEEIFGDIQDEHDNRRLTAREVQPGVYEISGRCEIADLNETFNLDLPESDEYQTLAGFILNNLGEIPSQGDTFDIKGMTFSIIKKSATRLELIRITVNPPEED
ncbi:MULTISPECIES: hemolysin family protein [Muribaculum]|jgi:CBS domain protein|uniref:HlyC/CorC family transporter n=12 Tax=Muribaculum TaxID=1918540 RepID=A0A4P7VR21_9BACT|nr:MULTISPECIES: hemolysin family protein [Muribaculum]MCX4277882.1 hemolysin family protein [Muribaculum sp.]QCD36763.1 HlyC/CorC family transporter [Muribaculum gordoncarteri]ROT15577.1 HlyC/CorC family transporter [Muribaculaceae bacterium Isolate-102 (HZI)]